jgi:SAGA-associated factor 29
MAVLDGQLKELDRLRKEQEQVIRKINGMHSRLQQVAPETAERYKDEIWIKLRNHYVKAKTLAESEESVSNTCVEQLNGLITPGQLQPNRKKPDTTEKQKRKRIKTDADSSRLSSPTHRGTTAGHNNLVPGDQVAARVTADDAENHEWIVVKLTRLPDRENNKYEVIDEEPDDDGGTGQRMYKLPPSCIIPFPKKTEASTAVDFAHGLQVLAVYPGTTALYKASVAGPPRKKKSEDYLLEFDGDEEDGVDGLPKRPVPFYHVVPLPDGHRQ